MFQMVSFARSTGLRGWSFAFGRARGGWVVWLNRSDEGKIKAMAADFKDGYWMSDDGLRLHYRDYGGPASRAPLLCVGGLTRNARDFESVAGLLKGKRRMIAVDLRGRGESAYAKDIASYNPVQYAQDIGLLLGELKLNRFVLLGTSLGGIVGMLLAASGQTKMRGIILNDVGPEIGAKGLDRIRSYVGQGRSFETWMHAAREIAETQGGQFPDNRLEDWLRIAKRCCKLSNNGRIVFDYDMKIAEPFRSPGGEAAGDLWPAFEAIGEMPVLIFRGETSDILEKPVAIKMAKRLPNADMVTVPRVGHAPSLDEQVAQKAIVAFLDGIK